jgi:ABC-type phosphate transport system auxiliary subunit
MRWIAAVVAAVVALIGTYYVVAYAACTWFWPQGNLCGLIAVPSGFIAALVCFILVLAKWK